MSIDNREKVRGFLLKHKIDVALKRTIPEWNNIIDQVEEELDDLNAKQITKALMDLQVEAWKNKGV